jgi:hypothetical protein
MNVFNQQIVTQCVKRHATKQDYDVAMHRAEALIDKATSAGGFANLSQDEVDEFGSLAAVASRYEDEVLHLYPFRSTPDFVTPTRKKASSVTFEYA